MMFNFNNQNKNIITCRELLNNININNNNVYFTIFINSKNNN